MVNTGGSFKNYSENNAEDKQDLIMKKKTFFFFLSKLSLKN